MTIDYANSKAVIDLVGLLQGTLDILVQAGVLADDNCRIVASHDGSRVLYDKARPRVEIKIEEVEE
jgi:Holliday junction resolvase RusA-like endonuclease